VFTKSSKLLISVLAIALMGLFIGCSDDDETPNTPNSPDMGEGAMLRVVHASPNAPAVDVYVKGVSTPLFSDAAYGATTGYTEVAAGDYTIELRGAGSPATSTPAFSVGPVTIPEGATITAIAAGNFGSTNADDAFRILPIAENFAAPGAGNAAVRVVHGSFDAPTVDIDLGDDGTVDFPGFARFTDTGEAGLALPAGQELQVGIRAGGSRVTAFTTPQLPEGANLFVIATGRLTDRLPREDDGFSLLAVGPAGTVGFIRQNPVVFALHGSPDAPAVDIAAGGAVVVPNLAFGELSAPVQVPPASYTLSFRAAGTTAEAASATTPVLAAGERYLAVASGFLGDNSFTLIPVAEAFSPAGGQAQVRVVHASPDAPAVDVGTVDSMGNLTAVSDFVDLSFEETSKSEGTALPVGSLPIGVGVTGTGTAAVTFTVPTSAGLHAFAVAAGSLLDNTVETFRLLVVDATSYPWGVVEINPNP
jgi:hypothetical protein